MTSNPWRGELTIEMSGREITLRCRMDTLAKLLEELNCKTLLEVTKKWDGLSPEVLRQTLRLMAQNPAEADEFWPYVTGLVGLELVVEKLYHLISGLTPAEILEDEEDRKKLQILLAKKSAEEIGLIVAALNLD